MDRKYLSLKEIVNKNNIGKKYEDIRTGDVYKLYVNKYQMLELRLIDPYINDEGLNVEEIYFIEQLFGLEFVEVK